MGLLGLCLMQNLIIVTDSTLGYLSLALLLDQLRGGSLGGGVGIDQVEMIVVGLVVVTEQCVVKALVFSFDGVQVVKALEIELFHFVQVWELRRFFR